MLRLAFDKPRQDPLKVLCLGAHSDDIEIGCGGTILRLVRQYPQLNVHWVVFNAVGERAVEARKSAEEFLGEAHEKQVVIKEFRDGYFPSSAGSIKEVFEELKDVVVPDLIFTHYRNDLHQDHSQICELTWNTWRDHLILEYEIPKYDGDLGSPTVFVPLEDDLLRRKIELLMKFFQTQANKQWFTPETFKAILRLRGVECRSHSGYAEAFYGRKIVF